MVERVQQHASSVSTADEKVTVDHVVTIGDDCEWLRGASGNELDDLLGISPATFRDHIRNAEKTVIVSVFPNSRVRQSER